MNAATVILVLQVAVTAVSVLLVAALVALALGRRSLHGLLNTVFFWIALSAVLGLEVAVRILWPNLSVEFFDPAGPYRRPLLLHLSFSIPATVILGAMMYTGRAHRGQTHRALSALFLIFWTGTVMTGLFGLPNSMP